MTPGGTSPLFVREAGHGATVLCLHANASTSGQWRGLMELLSPHCRLLAPDLLGAGRSAGWPLVAGARLQHEVDALAPLIASAGPSFHRVGHSYGAAVALRIASTWPQRIASAVLFEPTLFPLLNQPRPGDPAAIGIAAAATAASAAVDRGDLQAAAEVFIEYWMGSGSWAAMPDARRGAVAESMRPIRQWTDAIYAEPWSLDELAPLQLPVLLLGGTESPASAADLLPLLARTLPAATLQVLPGLGHMAPVTHPDTVNPLIARFLQGGPRASAWHGRPSRLQQQPRHPRRLPAHRPALMPTMKTAPSGHEKAAGASRRLGRLGRQAALTRSADRPAPPRGTAPAAPRRRR